MNDDLNNKTEAELNEIFATEVAGLPKSMLPVELRLTPKFTSDANLAIQWLEKWRYADIEWSRITMLWQVGLQNGQFVGMAHTLPLAAAIAMIRMKRKQP